MVIKALLVNKETLCIFFRSYDPNIPIEPQLLGGFLSAIHFLAQDLSRDQIKELVMGKSKIIYQLLDEKNDLTMAIITEKDAESIETKKLVEKIVNSFLNTFTIEEIESHFTEEKYFTTFEKIIDDLIKPGLVEEKSIDEIRVFPSKEKAKVDQQKVSLPFLLKTLKKDLGRVLFSLLVGRRVIVTGDPAMTKLMIDSLEILSPQHTLKKIYWAENAGQTMGDVVGVPLKIANLFIDSTVINLKTEKVVGFKDNRFFDDLVKDLKNKTTPEALSIITEKINFIIKKTKDLISFINNERFPEKKLEEFIQDVDLNILEVIETYLILNNPQSIKKIERVCQALRKKMTRVVRGFQKTKW